VFAAVPKFDTRLLQIIVEVPELKVKLVVVEKLQTAPDEPTAMFTVDEFKFIVLMFELLELKAPQLTA
jgi:hypothetical protein